MSATKNFNPVQSFIAPALNLAIWFDEDGSEFVYDGKSNQNSQLDNHSLSHILSIHPELIVLDKDQASETIQVLASEKDKYQTLKLVLELMDSNLSAIYREGIARIVEKKLSQKSVLTFVTNRLKGTLIPSTFSPARARGVLINSQVLLGALFNGLEISNELLSCFLTIFRKEMSLDRHNWDQANAILTDSGSFVDMVNAIKQQSRVKFYQCAKEIVRLLDQFSVKLPLGKFAAIERGLLDNYFLVLYDDPKKRKPNSKENRFIYNDVLMLLPPETISISDNSSRILKQVEKLKASDNYTEILYILNKDRLIAESDYTLYFERAIANFYLGNYKQSLDDCNSSLSLAQDVNSIFFKGINLFHLSQRESSLATFNELLKILPNYYPLYFNIGVLYFLFGDMSNAMANYNKALKLRPENIQILYGLGNVYYVAEEYKKAVAFYTKAVEKRSDFVKAYYNRGLSWYFIGDFSKAIVDFTTAISYDPSMSEAYHNRGTIYLETREYAKALEDFSKVLQLDAKNEDAKKKFDVAIKFKYGSNSSNAAYSKRYMGIVATNNKELF